MSLTVEYQGAIDRAVAAVKTQARFQVAQKVWAKMQVALSSVMAETPIWTGNTVANYVWGVGEASNDYTPVNQEGSWRTSGPDEGGRAHYEGISRLRLNVLQGAVFADPYEKYVLSNNVVYDEGKTITDLENGSLTGTPHLMFAKTKAILEFL